MLGHLRSQRTTKLQIFISWSLSVPTVGGVRGEDVVRSTLFWSSDGSFFRHPRRGWLGRYDSFWLAGVPYTLARRDAGSTRLRAILGLSLREPGLHRRLTRCGGINPYTLMAKLGPARIDGFGPPKDDVRPG